MSVDSLASIEGFQKVLAERIEKEKKGRVEVSSGEYWKLQLLRFVIVGGNGAFNALYGWSLGYNLLSCALLATVMFSGDWALSLLHQIGKSKEKAFSNAALLTKTGLVFLSLVAGTSFMLGIRHAQEIRNSRIPFLEEQIATNEVAFELYHKTITANRIERLNNELQAEKERVGDFSPANAFPQQVASVMQWDYEVVAIGLNILWIGVLLFTGLSLSAQLGAVWCPMMAKAIGKELTSILKSQMKLEEEHVSVLVKRQELDEKIASAFTPKDEEGGEAKTSTYLHLKAPPKQTSGAKTKQNKPRKQPPSTRRRRPEYEAVVQMVKERKVRPTQNALAKLGMGAQTGAIYLKKMKKEGVLKVRNKRGDYMLAVESVGSSG